MPKLQTGKPRRHNHKKRPSQNNNLWIWLIIVFTLLILINQSSTVDMTGTTEQELSYSEFYTLLQNNNDTGRIATLAMTDKTTEHELRGTFNDGGKFRVNIPKDDEIILNLIRSNVGTFRVEAPKTFWSNVLFSLGPVALLILFFWLISYRGAQMGNRVWAFGKSRAKMNTKKDQQVTFNDVAGVDEAKEELQEIIEFLKDPKRFQRLGGKIPKGVLLVGLPGTGKTLLAKAVSGEAGVPFFSLSGSDFVEMFVGVGASRVRDLFEQGRKATRVSGKGCIIFIDEIDAVGRLRFSGIGGGHDEREQTLNALLVEMDGFDTQQGLILIAATNRPDTLDPALLRPGRFDRRIIVPLPDIRGREAILKVHTKNIKLAEHINFAKIARQTVYFSGADLANVCNEAALLAARKNKEAVDQDDMSAAVERVTMGPEKKSHVISKKEKEITAYHEAGHALLSLLMKEVDTFVKVSIIPRGMAGGYTLTPPIEDRHYWGKSELTGRLSVALGGRAAEEICLHEVTTGAQNDLQNATEIARKMVCVYGMSKRLGTLTLGRHNQQLFLGRDIMEQKDYSEETAKAIDNEIRHLIDGAYTRAKKLLTANRDKLNMLATRLMEKEVIDVVDAQEFLGLKDTDQKNTEAPDAKAPAQKTGSPSRRSRAKKNEKS